MGDLLIYGASGFTGRLIVAEATSLGLPCVVAGRSRHKLEELARNSGIECRVAALEDSRALAEMLKGVAVVINAAGPFRSTAPKLAQACIDHGAHYLDLTGELSIIERLTSYHQAALRRGVMVLPAAGFDVVASDCLAALVARRLPQARSLALGLTGLDAISRGSAASVVDGYSDRVVVRRDGRLTSVSPGELMQSFDFGAGATQAAAVSWADVSSAYYSTGIGDITVYYEATPLIRFGLNLSRYAARLLDTPLSRFWQNAAMRLLPEGPGPEQRARGRATLVARVEDDRGRFAEGRLHTPEVYSFTATTAVAIAERALDGDFVPGFCTPSKAYGPEFVLSLPGVTYIQPVDASA